MKNKKTILIVISIFVIACLAVCGAGYRFLDQWAKDKDASRLHISSTETWKESDPQPSIHPGWSDYTNANNLSDLAVDAKGNIWSISDGGAVYWDIQQKTYQKYTTQQGLPSNELHSLAVASDDSVWFGTSAGLAHFDGHIWNSYTTKDGLKNDEISLISISSNGTVWINYFGDRDKTISAFNGKTWRHYNLPQKIKNTQEAVDYGFASITAMNAVSDTDLWIAANGMLFRFDEQRWQELTPDDAKVFLRIVAKFAPNQDGSIWVGADTGIWLYANDQWTRYSEEGCSGDIQDIIVARGQMPWAVLQPSSGSIPQEGGLAHFDGQKWTCKRPPDANKFPYSVSLHSGIFTQTGELWLATSIGLAQNLNDRVVITETVDHLRSNIINAISPYSKDHLLIGTQNGLYQFTEKRLFEGIDQKQNLYSEDVEGITVSRDGPVYFVHQNAFTVWHGNKWDWCSSSCGDMSGFNVRIVEGADGKIWISSAAGLFQYEKGKAVRVSPKEGANSLSPGKALAAAPDGSLWIAIKEQGVVHYGNEKILEAYTFEDGLRFTDVEAITVSKDNVVWIGTTQGASRFDGKKWISFRAENGLGGNRVNTIYIASDQKVWFGTDQGVSSFDGIHWSTFTTKDGLASNTVYAIYHEGDGSMWFGTSAGISRYSLKQ